MSQRKASNHEEAPFIPGSIASDGTAKVSKRDYFSRSMRMVGFSGDYGERSRSSRWKGMLKSTSWGGGLSLFTKPDDDTALLGKKPTAKTKKRTSWLPDRYRRNPIQGR